MTFSFYIGWSNLRCNKRIRAWTERNGVRLCVGPFKCGAFVR